MADISLPAKDRLQLAIEEYRQGKFKSIRKAASTYDVNNQTMTNRLNWMPSLHNPQLKSRKLP